MISVLYIALQANAKVCGDISKQPISPLYIVPLRFATSCVFQPPLEHPRQRQPRTIPINTHLCRPINRSYIEQRRCESPRLVYAV